jgi:D-threo-aldose 1-dehydrogenase
MTGTLPTRRLGRTALHPTSVGFGGGPIGKLAAPQADERARATLVAAWDVGIRYFDTAPLYGLGESERRLGAFLRTRPRGDFLLSTKVARVLHPTLRQGDAPPAAVYDYSRDGALRSLEGSFARLGLDRVDIALIHDIDRWTHGERQPERFREAIEGAYRALADLKAAGTIGAIGLGVNEWPVCEAFARQVPVDCFLLAGRHTLLERDAEADFLPFCAENGIGLIVGGPFNSGILATGPVPGALYNYAPAPGSILRRVERIEAVCREFGVPLPAAALAFPLRHSAVAAIIPGVDTPEAVAEIAAWRGLDIPAALWTALADGRVGG